MELQYLPIDKIRPNPNQPRETFDKRSLEELASSIKEHGIVQPIVVRQVKDRYEIIAGERRWRAYALAKITKVPAIVKTLEKNDVLLESLLENINREDLTPIERENAVSELWRSKRFDKLEDLGKQLGKRGTEQREFIERHLEAKKLRDKYKVPGKVSTQHLFEIAQLKDDDDVRTAIEKVVDRDLSVHQMRALIQTLKKSPKDIKRAILDDKVDIADVVPLLDYGIPEKMVQDTVDELSRRKKEREAARDIEREGDIAVLSGKMEAKRVVVSHLPSPDERRVYEFKEVRDRIRFWTLPRLEMIEDGKLRRKALDYVEEIRVWTTQLLRDAGESPEPASAARRK